MPPKVAKRTSLAVQAAPVQAAPVQAAPVLPRNVSARFVPELGRGVLAPAGEELRVFQQILSPKAVNFLLSQYFVLTLQAAAIEASKAFGYTIEAVINEFRRFIIMKVFVSDGEAWKISPTPLMDSLWHAAILDTKFYAALQDALGFVLHHQPSGALDKESELRHRRLRVMRSLYGSLFYGNPLERILVPPPDPYPSMGRTSNHLRLKVIHIVDEIEPLWIQVLPSAKIQEIVPNARFHFRAGHNHVVLRHKGHVLQDHETFGERGIVDGDIINYRPILRGC